MSVIDTTPKGYDKFLNELTELPFIRVAIFSALVCAMLSLFGLHSVSKIIFILVPLSIIARIASYVLCIADHPVTKFWMTSLFLGIEGFIVTYNSLPIIESITNTTLRVAVYVIVLIFGGIPSIGLFLAPIGFLVRIFIAFFIRH